MWGDGRWETGGQGGRGVGGAAGRVQHPHTDRAVLRAEEKKKLEKSNSYVTETLPVVVGQDSMMLMQLICTKI